VASAWLSFPPLDLSTQKPVECRIDIRGEFVVPCGRRLGVGAHHKQATRWQSVEAFTHQMTEPAADLVPCHRAADGTADGETDSRSLVDVVTALKVENQTRPSGTIPAPDGPCEFFSPPHPVSGRQHDRVCQTAMLARPLRRRDERIARPARVRMRSRKPCFLCRRRLFGW
jgi:hypothetical protein